MKFITLLFLSVSLLHISFGQSYWSDIEEKSIATNEARTIIPDAYRTLSLDIKQFNEALSQNEGKKNESIIFIPLPDGETAQFKVQKVSNFHPELAQKYPQIHSYLGLGIENESNRIRISITPQSFHAILVYEREEIYIDPYTENDNQYFISYYTKDDPVSEEMLSSYRASHAAQHAENVEVEIERISKEGISGGKNSPFTKNQSTKVVERKYRLALACTGEYAQRKGGTIERVLAAYNIALDRVNFVLQRDVGIVLELIPNNDELIFLDRNTDPFPSPQVTEVPSAYVPYLNREIGVENYDIGHVFTTVCPGGIAGVSGGVGIVCLDNFKARAASCEISTNDRFYISILCHEIGHQLNAEHTWNNCPTVDDPTQFNSSTAYEPGGGVTIMSYGLACGNQSYGQEYYYHSNSIEAILSYTLEGTGSTCATFVNTDNDAPTVEIDLENDFFIPISTPFELTARAEDLNQDALTYCWEQYDIDPSISDIGSPRGNGPSFRSFPPTTSPTRVFPRISTIINNQSDITEVLPTYSRDLTFRCTVRDNNQSVGGVDWEEVNFRSDETAGPFLVTFPNEQEIAFEAGSYQEITWDVANTTNSRVNCQFVNIKISLNGGQTFPITLVEQTPNDGSAFVTMPNVVTRNARIRVEAANNIFFDISNSDFRLTEPSQPTYTLNVGLESQQVCLPDIATVPITSGAILGYNDTIQLAVVDGLPEGATATFLNDQILPGDMTELTVDLNDVAFDGKATVIIQVVAPMVDTAFRSFELDIVSNDFSAFQTLSPENNTRGILINTQFVWTSVENAMIYNFQLSDSPTFENIINETTGLRDTSLFPEDVFLDENTLYYWRVQPVNECGAGAYSIPKVFQTVSVSCVPFEQNSPVTISGTGTPTVESTITINETGTITDLNIPIVVGSYQPVRFTEISLFSPAGTQAILFDDLCGGTPDFNIGFDDEAPDPITCPPTAGVVQRPIDSLAIFKGEDIEGEWRLRFRIKEAGFGAGGEITNWQLESCADIALSSPFLVTNDTLSLPPASRSQIWIETLEAQDDDNTYDEISYVLITVPEHGTLFKDETPLQVGDRFTQQDIEGFSISYAHDGSDTSADNFFFLLEDIDGGWFGVPKFNIVISEDATVDTDDLLLEDGQINIYPNPTNEFFQIDLLDSKARIRSVQLFDLNGRLVKAIHPTDLQIEVTDLSVGFYSLLIETDKGVYRSKLMVQR